MIDIDEPTRRKLRQLRLSTFADVFFDLLNDDANADELPEDIFFAAVDKALDARRERNIIKAITHARFAYPQATIADVTDHEARGINDRQLKRLATTRWREHPVNLHIFAPTGTGKTYIACALGVAACQSGHAVAYYRLDQLVAELAVLEPTGSDYTAAMRKLINVDLLIIDDFLTMSIDQRGQEDLTKIIIDRDGRLPTIISSQSTAAYWVEILPNRIGAESLVSRLNNGRRIQIGTHDIRKQLAEERIRDHSD
ncbi:IstB-like ATP-binding protein [Corynebacterium efficiens YS-314]|uniref:Putative transposase n=1 Tax=Corynebacterium efficiens (strain DSM 44549 / YS-314 / AJ 12310 / JCM 11189 / NBRC 100395) TaxID=196164 RepID=Q8FNN2_COREF|nr:ATP-binding protein [Corynebacterium efficiens]EEW49233.1 IstB-like ATP-binding protein [Corynebacterium efficiens YS-314]BAC18922.1 putative transposase [Corynebacterium efficiens YS-314]